MSWMIAWHRLALGFNKSTTMEMRFEIHSRMTIEKLAVDCLDVRELKRANLFKERTVTLNPFMRWPSVGKMRIERFLITLEMLNQTTPQFIKVSWTQCYFGGSRPWLHCPTCQGRAARLFHGLGGYYCRACIGNPVYESQRKGPKAKRYLQALRLRQRLDSSTRPGIDPLPDKPHRMKWITYTRICDRIEQTEKSILGSRVAQKALWVAPLNY